jgi:hypothetical protein
MGREMIKRLKLHRPSHTTVVAYLSLFLVISGGAALAANQLHKNSVGAKQIKKNAVIAAKIKNGAVTGNKLADNAVTANKIANGAVTTGKLGDSAVTTGKLAGEAMTTGKIANDAVTGAKVNEGSLHFTCNFPVGSPAFQLPGGGLCAFTSGGSAAWATSVNVCRGAATGGTMPTAAEFAAIAAVTGSPFRGISAWTSEVEGGGTPKGNIVTTDAGGAIASISSTELTLSPTTTTACVYDPALAPAPGS